MWQLSGYTAIYAPSEKGFSVYARYTDGNFDFPEYPSVINAETARALKQRYVIRWTAILSASQRDSTTTNVVLYGEEANTIPQFTVSPNPAQDWVNVTSAGDIQQILVYDITGQLLQQHVGIASFSTSTLPAATYVISVEFADGKIGSRKLVKQ